MRGQRIDSREACAVPSARITAYRIDLRWTLPRLGVGVGSELRVTRPEISDAGDFALQGETSGGPDIIVCACLVCSPGFRRSGVYNTWAKGGATAV